MIPPIASPSLRRTQLLSRRPREQAERRHSGSNGIEQNRTRSNALDRQNHDNIEHYCPPRSHDPQQYTGDHRVCPLPKENSSATPSARIPLLANRPNAVTQDRTESNRTEQDRTSSTDKTMTTLSITAHLDRTILSNTLEIVAHALAGKIPETLSTRPDRLLGRRVAS